MKYLDGHKLTERLHDSPELLEKLQTALVKVNALILLLEILYYYKGRFTDLGENLCYRGRIGTRDKSNELFQSLTELYTVSYPDPARFQVILPKWLVLLGDEEKALLAGYPLTSEQESYLSLVKAKTVGDPAGEILETFTNVLRSQRLIQSFILGNPPPEPLVKVFLGAESALAALP